MKVIRLAAASAAAMMLGAGGAFAADLDTMPTKAPVYKAPANTTCTSIVDFFTTACQLSAYGVRIYGTIDIGATYQTNGAPVDKFFPTGASYFQQKMNRQSMFGWGPNGLSQSNIGIQVTEPLGAGWKFVGQIDAGFDPVTGQFANGPGSLTDQFGKPVSQQTVNADSGRNGTFYNGQFFAGVSNDTWGTLTVGRQNSLTLDGVNAYDPMGGAYAFSPIGFSGKVPGGGNTEDTRYNESVKYRVNLPAGFRLGAIVEYGGQDLGNGAGEAFELSGGADFHVGPGVFSFDVIGGYMKDAVNLGLNSSNTALQATISDNTNVMLLAKYTVNKLQLSAGYEWVGYRQGSGCNSATIGGACVGGDFGAGTVIDNANTGFNPVSILVNQKPLDFQVVWAGGKYGITDSLDVAVAYYRYMNGRDATNPVGCTSATSFNPSISGSCAGTMNAASIMLDWKFAPKWDTYIGTFYSANEGGLGAGFLSKDNVATTAGIRFRF
jgi:predicted porin